LDPIDDDDVSRFGPFFASLLLAPAAAPFF
jgi:hypothetical protein